MFKMLHISPNNHAMIISWNFHPNSIIFEQVIAENPFLLFLSGKITFGLLAPWTKNEHFPEKTVFTRFLLIFLPNFMPKIRKILGADFEKNLKNPIFYPLWPIFSKRGIFGKNRAPSLFYVYEALTSCKKAEKSLEPVPVTLCHGQTNRQTDRQQSF